MIAVLLTAALRTLATGILAEGIFRLLRVYHPVFRKAVWACILVTGFAMPMLQAHSFKVGLPFLQNRSPAQATTRTVLAAFGAPSVSAPAASSVVHVEGGAERSASHLPGLSAWLLMIYLLPASILLLRIAFGLLTATRILCRSVSFSVSSISIRLSTEIETPWTFGSIVLLPVQARTWNYEQLRLVLAHEICHIRQFDFYLQLAARLYAALFWFSPLSWWLLRECERLGEQTATAQRFPLQKTVRFTQSSCCASAPTVPCPPCAWRDSRMFANA